MKIYIACSLTHVPRIHFREYTAHLHKLAGILSSLHGHEVKYALVDSDPQLGAKPIAERARLCYQWDCRMIQESDVVLAECSFPSIGLGIELQIAAERGIPVVIAFRDFHGNRADAIRYVNPDHSEHDLQIGEGFVSLMALGMPNVMKVHRYSLDDDGIEQIAESIGLLQLSHLKVNKKPWQGGPG